MQLLLLEDIYDSIVINDRVKISNKPFRSNIESVMHNSIKDQNT